MYTYYVIETNQDKIEISNLIRTIWPLQDDNKQDFIASVETYKKVYLFYQAPYKSNADYI